MNIIAKVISERVNTAISYSIEIVSKRSIQKLLTQQKIVTTFKY